MNCLFIWISICISLFFVVENFAVKTEDRIFAGFSDSKVDKAPWAVALMEKKYINREDKVNRCSGGIISSKHILTAAHCIMPPPLKGEFEEVELCAVIGVYDLRDENAQVLAVKEMYVPLKFNPTHMEAGTTKRNLADIAVLKLSTEINFGRTKTPISKLELPTIGAIDSSTNIIFAGYGHIRLDSSSGTVVQKWPGKRRWIKMGIVENAECRSRANRELPVDTAHLCAKVTEYNKEDNQYNYGGLCRRDSGGPLVAGKNVVIGVLSTSSSVCDDTKRAAIFTRVSEFVQFIKKALNEDPNLKKISSSYYAEWSNGILKSNIPKPPPNSNGNKRPHEDDGRVTHKPKKPTHGPKH